MKKSDEAISIFIATHQSFQAPTQSIYKPIHVGSLGKESLGYPGDHTGEHISQLNPYFCELTAMYWAWKNCQSDYVGLVHYRRYFSKTKQHYRKDQNLDAILLDADAITSVLTDQTIIVPKKRNYYISTLYEHYADTFDKMHLEQAKKSIQKLFPEYTNSFDVTLQKKTGYMFNMFIAKKELFDRYCQWLFPILFDMKENIDVTHLTPFEQRLFGRVSELLFNVYLAHEKIEVIEKPLYDAFQINWFKKGGSFLLAKLFHRKYQKSF